MKTFRTYLLLGFLVCCFTTMSFSQIFNYDYFLNQKTSSTQTSLVACDNGHSASVHNVVEGGSISDQLARDILVNVVDLAGNIQFTKKYGNTNSNDRGNSIVKQDDGGFIIVGTQLHPSLRSNGVLAYKINSAGVIQWSNWYGLPETRIGGEGFVVRRVDADQVLIAGTSTSSRDIIALLIKNNGGLIWSKRYSMVSIGSVNLVSRVVTELIEDQTLDGFIIAGTQYEGNTISTNAKSRLFTMAVDLNGNISRKYTLYEIDGFSSAFNPAMAVAFQAGNFVLTCGARGGIIDALPNSYTVVMELDDNLEPLWTRLYSSPSTINQHGHSIYQNGEANAYSVGCLYQGFSFTELFVPRNTAFLSVSSNGSPNYLLRYKRSREQLSTYMAFDAANGAYLIKSDNVSGSDPSLGLIRTNLSGRSSCARSEIVNSFEVKTEFKRIESSAFTYGGAYETRMSTVDFPLRPDQCFYEAVVEEEQPELGLAKKEEAQVPIHAYPTVLTTNEGNVKVEVRLEEETKLTLRVHDGLGRLMIEQAQWSTKGYNQWILDASELPAGIHILSLVSADQTLLGTTKVVKQ